MDSISNLEDQERQRLTRICWLYYIEELTHKEIGERLGLSRVKVTRLLRHAREIGIVQIKIEGADALYSELEHALCEAFQLRDAVVVTDATPGPALFRALAQGASNWLAPRLKADMLVGLSLGRTLSYLPTVFKMQEPVNCGFTEIIGGGSEGGQGFSSYSICSRMAELTGGQAHYINAPTVVSNPELRDLLVQDPSVAKAIERASRCEITLQSVGSMGEDNLLYQKGYLDEEKMQEMVQRGVVGDLSTHFVDKNGRTISTEIGNRCIALSLDHLHHIPWNVCVAGGPAKAEIIWAALQSKIFNVLITDTATARNMLKQHQQAHPV